MKNLWQFLNSPLIVLLAALCLWPFISAWEHRIAVHSIADAVVVELNRSTKELNDEGKKSGIKTLVSTFVSQFIDGFNSALEAAGQGQEAKQADFRAAQNKVSLTEVKIVPSPFNTRERIIGVVHNGASASISNIRLNLMMYGADGQLLDVADESLNDVKVLRPGQDVGFAVDRDIGESDLDKPALATRRATTVKAQIVSFDIEQEPKAK